MSQFKCTIDGLDLCFDPDNSTCYETSNENEFCVCGGSGYGADNLYLHIPNCAMPKNYYEIYLAIHLFLFIMCAAVLFPIGRMIKRGSSAFYLVVLAVVHHLLMVIYAACILAQNGNYESSIVVFAIKNCVLCYIIHIWLHMMLEPVYIGHSKDFRPISRRLTQLKIGTMTIFIIFGSVLAAYCRNDNVFNYLALGSLAMNCVISKAYILALIKIIAEMIKTLDLLSNHLPTVDEAKARLRIVRRNFIIIGIIFCIFPLGFIPYAILGSIPFAYVFTTFIDCIFFGFSVPIQVYLFLNQKATVRSQVSTSRPEESFQNRNRASFDQFENSNIIRRESTKIYGGTTNGGNNNTSPELNNHSPLITNRHLEQSLESVNNNNNNNNNIKDDLQTVAIV